MKEDDNTTSTDNWKACIPQKGIGGSNPPHSAIMPFAAVIGNVAKRATVSNDVAIRPTKNLQKQKMNLQRIHIVPSLTASRCRQDGTSMVRLQVNFKSKTAYITTNVWVKPSQWDKLKFVHSHPYADNINAHIRAMVAQYEDAARQIVRQGGAKGLTALQVRDKLVQICTPVEKVDANILDVMQGIADVSQSPSTKRIFKHTVDKLRAWGASMMFADITPSWLAAFDAWLAVNGSPSRNARNIHLRNIRRAFNKALEDGTTSAPYPFKNFSIKPEPVPPSAYTIEELRTLYNCTDCTPAERYWVDMLVLSFALIGINMADITDLAEIKRGRVNYTRKKTGKVYTVKVQPLALEIINRHRSSTDGRLIDILDKYASVHIATNACAKHLTALTKRLGLPHASWYTARYTWASIAANECGMSIDTISLALGHTYGMAVTLGYISPDLGRVDKANAEVIAKVF